MGSLMIGSLHYHCWVRGRKKIENRSNFVEVMGN